MSNLKFYDKQQGLFCISNSWRDFKDFKVSKQLVILLLYRDRILSEESYFKQSISTIKLLLAHNF